MPGVRRSLQYPEEVPRLPVPDLPDEQIRLSETILGGCEEINREDGPSSVEKTSREFELSLCGIYFLN